MAPSMSVQELCSLVSKVEACAGKAKESAADRERACDLLQRIGRELTSKEVLQIAQEKERAGKRLRRLQKHECESVSLAATKVLTTVMTRLKNQTFKQVQAEKLAVKKPEVKQSSAGAKAPANDGAGSGSDAAVDPLTKNRQVVKKALLEGFKLACEETGKPIELAEKIAEELEEELHKKYGPENGKVSKEYKMKYRSLSFNIKDKTNPDLRRRILLGEIACKDIITWTPHQLASDKRKEDNVEIKKTALLNAQARAPTVSSTDQFKCGKCGQRKCTYYQMQTRSADEPMTTFVTCTNCNNRWKFS